MRLAFVCSPCIIGDVRLQYGAFELFTTIFFRMPYTYLHGFQSQPHEANVAHLAMTGSLPAWLSGTLLRIGPGKFEVGAHQYRHWFDGLALLHKFSFADGQAHYASKFLGSNAYRSAERTGKIAYREFATDPCRSLFQRVFSGWRPEYSDNANVSIGRIDGQFVAMTETPLPIQFDAATLETLGVLQPDDRMDGQITTAHPHHDPELGADINYLTSFGKQCVYRIFARPDGSTRRQLMAEVPVQQPAYMHSFAMTRRFVILTECPFVVTPLRIVKDMLIKDLKPFIHYLEWLPERNTRFTVIRKSDGAVAGRWEAEAFATFHHINAYEQGDELFIDLCAYPDARHYLHSMYLDKLRDTHNRIHMGEFRRYRLIPGVTTASYDVMSGETIDLPQIHYAAVNGRPYRYAYGVSNSQTYLDSIFNQLVKVDTQTRATQTWCMPDGYPSEPIFVARPGAAAEDDGVVLSVVLDGKRNTSFLLALDAATFQERARAEVGQHLPFSFHGGFWDDVKE